MSASESRSAVVMGLAEEFLERYRQGQRPSLKEYIDRHPELAAEIREVFPAMALMENIALGDESLAGAATGPETAGSAAPPEQLGDYRILREVGRGGMGIVYEAEQVSLGRHVALKVLPRKVLLDAAQRLRFEREAKAAAKLYHTNIVPVFGVGEHEGLPYYVMQFIQGLGLDDVLDELKHMQGGTATGGELCVSRKDVSAADVARSLLTGAFPEGERGASSAVVTSGSLVDSQPTSGPLVATSSVILPRGGKGKKATYWQSVAQIGVQVAEALEYAHKQGIQHRDIKPSNLLLDTAGTVWVTDFGLARADNEDHLTQTGDIVGTLRYMPPEAFEGRYDKRGDIYSLGLTLYEMLARKPAFEERERHRLIKRVTTEEPPRLDKLNRVIPRDLVTIVHKAIDREPSRRYQTVGELTADLQRFLDDEPIQARRISSRERLLRWCRHHPGVATLTAILVLFLVGVTAASLLMAAHFDRLARQERQVREDAEQAKTQTEQQKQRAESNFAKARKAVDDYFTIVSESQLLNVSGMQPLRRDLLLSSLEFYQDFLKERGDDPSLRGELAAAFLRAGNIRYELGEGREAHNAWEKSCQLYEAVTKAAPESVEWRHGLAQCYFRLGRDDEAIALWEKLVQPGQPHYQKELANAYNHRALNYTNANQLAESLQDHQQALASREMLVRLNPDDPGAQRDLSGTLNNLGVLLMKRERIADALAMYRRAVERAEAAFAQAPQVLVNGRFLAIEQNNIARIERRLGHSREALAAYRRAVEVRQKLARDNPAIPSVHADLFNAYWGLAGYQRELKQTPQYERTMRVAREALDRMTVEGAEGLYNLACIRCQFVTFLAQGKEKATDEERAEQKREAERAVEALRKAVAAGFRDLNRFLMAAVLNPLRGREDFKAVEADLAARVAAASADKLKANQQAPSLRQKMAQADPNNKHLQTDLAASRHAIALIHLDLGKWDEARRYLEQAVALREVLGKAEPNNARYQADLAASRIVLESIILRTRARRFVELKGHKEAEAALAKIEEFKSNDLEVWKECGRLRFALGQTDKAAADFRKAVELLGDQALLSESTASSATSQADKLFAQQFYEVLLQRLTAAIDRNPGDTSKRWQRGDWHARHRRWKEAAADFTSVLEKQAPADALQWMHAAPVLAAAGDHEGYRQLCRAMLRRFGETQEPPTADRVAKGCLLLPDIPKDMNLACQLADRAATLGKNHLWASFFVFCKGLADYRRGDFRAVSKNRASLLPPGLLRTPNGLNASCQLVLAMALHRQGDAKAAREHLAQAAKLLDRYVADPDRFPAFTDFSYNHDWLIAWLLYREAQTLIEDKKAEPKK